MEVSQRKSHVFVRAEAMVPKLTEHQPVGARYMHNPLGLTHGGPITFSKHIKTYSDAGRTLHPSPVDTNMFTVNLTKMLRHLREC